MTKGALYRHYKSKRDIFDCIVERMEQGDSEQAAEYDMSEDDKESMPDQYKTVSLEEFVEYSKSMFAYWTEDDFASVISRHGTGMDRKAMIRKCLFTKRDDDIIKNAIEK